ncbi:DUF6879 family protein [Kitasatospora sp. NPDC091207]|uniref:DUF6879 family protein n=1 Tax=Kitasatospora sp. NPDC091207 TaxID=3364083 RepID=UPI0038295949
MRSPVQLGGVGIQRTVDIEQEQRQRHTGHPRRGARSDTRDLSCLTARRVSVRRARIASEPVTDYIRYEHAGTVVNLGAGEQVRWLPRKQSSDLALPGNDFWLLDGRLVRFGHLSGDGAYPGETFTDDPTAAALCDAAFEAVWQRATPHEKYEV